MLLQVHDELVFEISEARLRELAPQIKKIMEEVVKHLTTLYGANVQVTLEIQAEIPGGVPEETMRTVTENCRTLRFESFGFEEE